MCIRDRVLDGYFDQGAHHLNVNVFGKEKLLDAMEQNGLLASLNSVAKLPYHWALDGISNTQTINPEALGHSEGERVENLVQVLDGYFDQGAHHLNVNVFGKEKLLDAMEHPEKEEYANFTIRVSGYAVKFIDLTREQQMDVISRTCHAVL